MLDCRHDRLDYGKLLRPPAGHVLDRAVATTYSADLQALLSIPVALVYAQTLEGDLSEARFQLLEAIKQFASKVVVYHQEGQLHVPPTANWLYAFLEDALAPILPDDAFCAFHPKTWLIRYRPEDEEGPPLYRLLVLSRNLTFERSWDVAASFEGTPGSKVIPGNKPLVDFHRWLHAQRPIAGATELFEELARVSFDCPDHFDELLFHPVGIPGHQRNPVATQKSRRTVVISPFLHPQALQTIRKNTAKRFHVLSERHALERVPLEIRKQFQSYALSDLIIDGETLDLAEDGGADVQRQHLHAKLFVFRTAEGNSRWFLGSANATEAAFHKNVEFMVELRSDHWSARPHYLLKDLVDAEGHGPFLELPPDLEVADKEAEQQRTTIRRFEHALLSAEMSARVERGSSSGTYDLHLEIEAPDFPPFDGFAVTVKPFNIDTAPQALSSGAPKELHFSGISEIHLSRFLHFQVVGKDLPTRQFLVCIPIRGLPKERLEHIFRRIIDSQDKFFQYLRFLLADEIGKEDLLRLPGAEGSGGSNGEAWLFDSPLYEQLLVAASRSPAKLRAVDEVVGKLRSEASEVVPEEFLSFWEAFRPLLPTPRPTKDE